MNKIYLLGLLAVSACSGGAGTGAARAATPVVRAQATLPVAQVGENRAASAPLEYSAQAESDRVFIENAERAIGQYSEFLARAGEREEYAQAVKRSREQIEDLRAAIVFVRSGAQERAFRQQ